MFRSAFVRHLTVLTAALALAAPTPASSQVGKPPAAEHADVVRALDAFHDALRRGDGTAALSLMAEDALVYESGHAERKNVYAAHHLASDSAYAKAVPASVTTRNVEASGPIAWVTTEGRTAGTFKGKAVNRRTVETALLRYGNGKWQIVHLHWSSAAP